MQRNIVFWVVALFVVVGLLWLLSPILLPFVLVIIGCLMVVTYVPVLSLGLRDLVYAK